MNHRVVLVRASTAGGGGCCGGDVRPFDPGGSHHTHPAAPHPVATDDVAAVYEALCTALPDVDVQIVAPTNWMFLLPELVRGGRRRGLRGSQLGRSVRAGIAVQSLVVDGAVLVSGGLPAPARAVALVREQLALP